MVEETDQRPGSDRWPYGGEPPRSDGKSGPLQVSDLRRLVLLPTLNVTGRLDPPMAASRPITPRSTNSPRVSLSLEGKGSPRDSVHIAMPPQSSGRGSMHQNMQYKEHEVDGELGVELETEEEFKSRRELRRMYTRKGRQPLWVRLGSCFQWLHGMPPLSKADSVQRRLLADDIRQLDVFKRLRAVYKVPPPIKLYDATTPYSSLLGMEGSVLKLVLCRIDFWFLLLMHVFLSVIYYRVKKHEASRLGPDGGPMAHNWPEVTTSLLTIPGVLIAFLLVFYNNQCYMRFSQQYLYCQFQSGILSELVLLLRAHLHDAAFPEAKEERIELWKLLHAMHLLGFAGLPQQRAESVDIWVWHYAYERGLLNRDQIERLKPLLAIGSGNLAYKEVMTWLQRRFWNLCDASSGNPRIHPKVGMLFSETLWRLRYHIDILYVMTNGPIPFAYYHLANMVLIAYLVLLAYSFVFVSPYYSIAGYALILLGFLGMSELANVLADPFGTDETDLPIFDFVNTAYVSMQELVNMRPFEEEAPESESLDDMKNKSI